MYKRTDQNTHMLDSIKLLMILAFPQFSLQKEMTTHFNLPQHYNNNKTDNLKLQTTLKQLHLCLLTSLCCILQT